MRDKIVSIIENQAITTVFQPIINVKTAAVLGYEALSRGPEHSEFHSPEILFSVATQYGLLSELEILCRDSAIKRFAQLNLPGKLFLNISPMVLLDSAHPQGKTVNLVQQSGLSCEQIVIEISEKYPFPNGNLLYNALAKYRQFGFDVAIDDLGSGYSGLQQWCTLQPDIVKIDRYFVAQCDANPMKQQFLKSLFTLGQASKALVIAEGIETLAEYELLAKLGMTYAQGFFLARPTANPARSYQLPVVPARTRPPLELAYCQA